MYDTQANIDGIFVIVFLFGSLLYLSRMVRFGNTHSQINTFPKCLEKKLVLWFLLIPFLVSIIHIAILVYRIRWQFFSRDDTTTFLMFSNPIKPFSIIEIVKYVFFNIDDGLTSVFSFSRKLVIPSMVYFAIIAWRKAWKITVVYVVLIGCAIGLMAAFADTADSFGRVRSMMIVVSAIPGAFLAALSLAGAYILLWRLDNGKRVGLRSFVLKSAEGAVLIYPVVLTIALLDYVKDVYHVVSGSTLTTIPIAILVPKLFLYFVLVFAIPEIHVWNDWRSLFRWLATKKVVDISMVQRMTIALTAFIAIELIVDTFQFSPGFLISYTIHFLIRAILYSLYSFFAFLYLYRPYSSAVSNRDYLPISD